MSSAATSNASGNESIGGRSRNAPASKQALLQAAQELFGLKGYESTTIRDIGEKAGVDAALIARYFGSKAHLYIAAVVAEDLGDRELQEYERLEHMADAMLARADERGPGPILQALIRADTAKEIREAAQDRMAHRLVEPLEERMNRNQVSQARLRAEVVVSALFGISLGRTLGWFEEIRSVPREELVALIVDALGQETEGEL